MNTDQYLCVKKLPKVGKELPKRVIQGAGTIVFAHVGSEIVSVPINQLPHKSCRDWQSTQKGFASVVGKISLTKCYCGPI